MNIIMTTIIPIKGVLTPCILVRFEPGMEHWYKLGTGNSKSGLTLSRITTKRELGPLHTLGGNT